MRQIKRAFGSSHLPQYQFMPTPTNPNQLERRSKVLKGRWELDKRHRLTYKSDEDLDAEEAELEASLIAAEAGGLVVAVTEKQKEGKVVTSLARLSGNWRANDKNEIQFEIEKEFGKKDVLTFRGNWKVGKSNEIIYTYRKTSLKTKTRTVETLTFKGTWDISEKNRLAYTLEGSTDETFRFRGAFQTKSIAAKKGELRYQIGIEAAGKKKTQTLILFGKWKLSNKLELSFEMEYENGRRHEIRFGAVFHPGHGLTIDAELISREGDSLGIELTLTKELFQGQAETFLRLRKSVQESAVEAGIRISW